MKAILKIYINKKKFLEEMECLGYVNPRSMVTRKGVMSTTTAYNICNNIINDQPISYKQFLKLKAIGFTDNIKK